MDREDYSKAVFWFELATNLKKPEESWGFIMSEFWDFIPNIQLSVCYSRLGNVEAARKYNEKAGEFKPNHPSVLQNRRFYESLKNNSKAE
jgi:Flp pilus assembly protein TadD